MRAVAHPPPLELFSLGGLFGMWWHTDRVLAPFLCSASLLASLAMWDWLLRAGAIDFTLLGLAGYELIVGLTE
jgi:hypothetical protein